MHQLKRETVMVAPANNSEPDLQPKSNTDLVVIRDLYRHEKRYCLKINLKKGTYSAESYNGSDPIHGVGVQSEAGNLNAIRAYFSLDHLADKSAPRYELSMFFAINGEIFCLHDGSSKFTWEMGFFKRSFRIRRPLKDDFVYSYAWPFYRQIFARVFGDPFNFTSEDFFEVFFEVAKTCFPNSFTTK
jgi:hypothetical protein